MLRDAGWDAAMAVGGHSWRRVLDDGALPIVGGGSIRALARYFKAGGHHDKLEGISAVEAEIVRE